MHDQPIATDRAPHDDSTDESMQSGPRPHPRRMAQKHPAGLACARKRPVLDEEQLAGGLSGFRIVKAGGKVGLHVVGRKGMDRTSARLQASGLFAIGPPDILQVTVAHDEAKGQTGKCLQSYPGTKTCRTVAASNRLAAEVFPVESGETMLNVIALLPRERCRALSSTVRAEDS